MVRAAPLELAAVVKRAPADNLVAGRLGQLARSTESAEFPAVAVGVSAWASASVSASEASADLVAWSVPHFPYLQLTAGV